MIKKLGIALLLSINLNATISPMQGVAFVNMEIVKQECIWCTQKSEQLNASLKNIDVQIQLYEDQLASLDEKSQAAKELDFKIKKLGMMVESLCTMHSILVDCKIAQVISEVLEKEGYSAAIPSNIAVVVHPLFDITYKVINRMNMQQINDEDKKDDLYRIC